MKKELVDFLNTDLQFIKGVGPVLASRFNEVLGGRRVLDFMLHRPAYVRSREIIDGAHSAKSGDIITVSVQVKSHKPGGTFRGRRTPTQIVCHDKLGGNVVIQFFGSSFLDYWLGKLPIGEWRVVSGRVDFNGRGDAVINHPEFIETPENAAKIPTAQAVYPAGDGVTQKSFTNVRDSVFAVLADKMAAGNQEPESTEFFAALRQVHFPQSADDLAPTSDAMMKLAYCELFAHQSAIAISRRARATERHQQPPRDKKHDLLPKFYSALPFSLTGAQERALSEIFDDMKKSVPMMRLVQGDVGSGKTVVALAAATAMAEFSAQTVLLAPTDTLAQQHYAKLKPICDSIGIFCDILTGRDKGKPRGEKLISLRSGRTRLAVGTHALFSEDVEYKDLGLVVIDEQHRFGVAQREAMRAKGANPDLLALSATPIPRTLSMTVYGDMDISIINEKPAGRLPIKTTKLSAIRAGELAGRLAAQVAAGAKVFWVCPLVEESEASDLMAAEKRYEFLTSSIIHHPSSIGIVHGKMDKKQRDRVMDEFAAADSKMRVLVSTTVIEVGIDVPAATIMVIENAERFGLAALHQLRGRVGRGSAKSFCILMFGNNITEEGLKRLDVLCETDDGFLIAEQDLMMRGVGELLGTKQSGWIAYHFVDYREHRDLFKLAGLRASEADGVSPWPRDLMFIFGQELTVKA
ncbi:MAG: ATP-dependent DNA helicase RecG [Rickettsiales bacterium]|jgi:ATP-dependent DNA helicase RecG|nr:ATP-dependent DNA helicase RecG [Rickettsiales bacterium]